MNFVTPFFKNVCVTVAMAVASNCYAQSNTEPALEKDEPSSEAYVADNRQEERNVIAQMAMAGYSNFVLVSKKNSEIYLIEDSQFKLRSPIIWGRGQGQKNLTPSGIFSLRNVFQGEAQPKMYFSYNDDSVYLIHGVVPGREKFLQVDNMKARQQSAGCINVPEPSLSMTLNYARMVGMANPDGEATTLVIMDEKYSSSKFAQKLENFKPAKYNPNLY